ncbi:MAG: hypothetical protein GYA33_01770 [Thermogutta sp.]|nr:hypothetical protein [Thermogutta sp.]
MSSKLGLEVPPAEVAFESDDGLSALDEGEFGDDRLAVASDRPDSDAWAARPVSLLAEAPPNNRETPPSN